MLTVFENEGFQVRTVTVDDETLFVAADLAEALGLTTRRLRQKWYELDDDEKGGRKISTLGGEQTMNVVTEPGLINLILSCPKSRQKDTGPWRYRRWVTHEVLPSIHRTGEYRTTIARLRQELAQATNNSGVLRNKNTFLRNNRLYHIAWGILANNPGNYYRVKTLMKPDHRQYMLQWEESTPYVKPDFVQTVRTLIQNLAA